MRDAYIIFADQANWSVARLTDQGCEISPVEGARGLNPESALAAANSLKQAGYRSQNVLLTLPSRQCLSASVDEMGLQSGGRLTARRNRTETLRFRLEEQLPLALEEFVADFLSGDGVSLGVAIAVESIATVLKTFEEQQIDIIGLCPMALLAAQYILDEQDATHSIDAILCAGDDHLDWIELDQNHIRNWMVLPLDTGAVDLQLRMTQRGLTCFRICPVGLSDILRNHLTGTAGVELMQGVEKPPLQLASQMARKVLLNGAVAPVELRTGPLASPHPLRQVRKPLGAVIVAATGLAIVFFATMVWRSFQYDHQRQFAQSKQVAAFRTALPNRPPPSGITSRMISETRRLRALSGTAAALPPSASVLPLLHDTLTTLPANMRFRFLELQFDPQRLYLEGQTLNHADADRLAAAIRRIPGLNVEPPHTEQLNGEDVTFTISASLNASTGPAPVLAAGKEGAGQ